MHEHEISLESQAGHRRALKLCAQKPVELSVSRVIVWTGHRRDRALLTIRLASHR